MRVARLKNWTQEQEDAFQEFLQHYIDIGDPVPDLFVLLFRKGMRDRKWSPERIRKHRGLLPVIRSAKRGR